MALNYPLQDGFETILTQDLTAAGTTAYIKVAPTFNFPAGVKTYVVINPQKSNMELVEIDAYDSSAKTLNITTRGLSLSQGVAGTAYSHSTGSRVLISDNMKFWKDLSDTFGSKADVAGTTFTGAIGFSGTDHFGVKHIQLTEAQRDALTPQNGYIIYNTTSGELQYYDGGAWQSVGTASVPNASTTVAGIVEEATAAEVGAGTATGGTGARTFINAGSCVKTSSGVSDENKIPVLDATGKLANGFTGSSITGEIRMWTTNTPPTGWLTCDGSTVSRTTYSSLFAVIGTSFNIGGEAGTDFRLPNLKGRTAYGRDSSDANFDILGNTPTTYAGEKTHLLTSAESGVPAHTHTSSTYGNYNGSTRYTSGDGGGSYSVTSGANAAANASSAHNNLPPYTVLNYIIKT